MHVGSRIKQFRRAKRLSMRELAERVGVSESYISQLEKGSVNPSLGSLKKLALHLDVNMVNFFSIDQMGEEIIVRKADRREIVYPNGKIRAQLMVAKLAGKLMEPLYTIIEPGGDTLDPYSHGENSEEFGVVIRGELLLTLDGSENHLFEGDAFYFKSGRFHRWSNPGKVTTEIVWIISPPTF